MTRKAYVDNWRHNSDGIHVDLRFRRDSKGVRILKDERDAETQCRIFNKSKVVIPSNEGGTYVLRDFKVEKLGPNQYVIVCRGPFLAGS
jgi:hypothetical protein